LIDVRSQIYLVEYPESIRQGHQVEFILNQSFAKPICEGKRYALATPALCAYGTIIAWEPGHRIKKRIKIPPKLTGERTLRINYTCKQTEQK
jgi:hypothetical protein